MAHSSAQAFKPYVSGIVGFLRNCWLDEERTDAFCASLINLLGDFGDTYRRDVRDELMQEWVQDAVAYGRSGKGSRSAKDGAAYLQSVSRTRRYRQSCSLPGHQGAQQVKLRAIYCLLLTTSRNSHMSLIPSSHNGLKTRTRYFRNHLSRLASDSTCTITTSRPRSAITGW
jgi:hypothetical protein